MNVRDRIRLSAIIVATIVVLWFGLSHYDPYEIVTAVLKVPETAGSVVLRAWILFSILIVLFGCVYHYTAGLGKSKPNGKKMGD